MPVFATLWSNHPNIKGDAPLLDKKVYENQCAINVSAAWMRSGMSLAGYPGALSWEKDKPKYAIRAQELANWFASPHSHLRVRTQKFSGKEVFEKINNKTGSFRLTHWISWVQIHARIRSVGINSDFRRAESIWFWEMP